MECLTYVSYLNYNDKNLVLYGLIRPGSFFNDANVVNLRALKYTMRIRTICHNTIEELKVYKVIVIEGYTTTAHEDKSKKQKYRRFENTNKDECIEKRKKKAVTRRRTIKKSRTGKNNKKGETKNNNKKGILALLLYLI